MKKYRAFYKEYPVNLIDYHGIRLFNLCLPQQEHEPVDEQEATMLKLRFRNLVFVEDSNEV